MKRKSPRVPVAAGDTRSRFGQALDSLLPQPELRRSFRRWRHTRPFWAGVLVIAAGLVLIATASGPWAQMVMLGSDVFIGIAIGLVMILGGLFLWFAPQNRLFVSLVLMICSVLALVASNLGGWFVGMILGMTGSAMAFGWREGGDYKRKGAAVALVSLLAASSLTAGLRTEPALAQQSWPNPGCGSTPVNSATVVGKVSIVETLVLRRKGCPSLKVSRIFIHDATLTDYHLQSPATRTGEVMQLSTDLHLENTELLTTVLYADLRLGAILEGRTGIKLPFDPPLPTGFVPITPQLVDTLDSAGMLGVVNPLSLDATNASFTQPLVLSPTVELSNTAIRVVEGPTITVPGT